MQHRLDKEVLCKLFSTFFCVEDAADDNQGILARKPVRWREDDTHVGICRAMRSQCVLPTVLREEIRDAVCNDCKPILAEVVELGLRRGRDEC